MKGMDNPKVAMLIALKAKKKMMGDGDGEMYADMAGDILDAIKSGDRQELGEALKAFVKACVGSSDDKYNKEDKEDKSEY